MQLKGERLYFCSQFKSTTGHGREAMRQEFEEDDSIASEGRKQSDKNLYAAHLLQNPSPVNGATNSG